MQQLRKVMRVISKQDETAPHDTLLVLDATTGQNAHSQVETFQKMCDVTGLVVTKLNPALHAAACWCRLQKGMYYPFTELASVKVKMI